MLAGLVGINVYVFFFNRGTAPRDVLNVQSTSKSLDGKRHDLLAKDAEHARGLLAASASSTMRAPAETTYAAELPKTYAAELPKVKVKLPPPRPSALSALPVPLAGSSASVHEAAPVVLVAAEVPSARAEAIPFVEAVPPAAPPAPRGTAASSSPRGAVQVPWAPPEDDGESATGEDGTIERKFGNAVTLSQVLEREGFGPGGPRVVAALSKLVDPKTIQPGQKYFVRLDDTGTPEAFEYQPSVVLRYIVERDDQGLWSARKAEQAVETKTIEAGGIVESSLYESVQKAGESTSLRELARRAVRVGRELLHGPAPRRSLEGRRREAAPRRQVL